MWQSMRISKSEQRPCRACGDPVPHDAPFGHCPKCLIELGFGPLPEDWIGALNARGIEVVRDIAREAARAVLKAYGEAGGARY